MENVTCTINFIIFLKRFQMFDVEEFIKSKEGRQFEILDKLHRIITVFDFIKYKIRFKIPFYDAKNWVCYLNPLKYNAVEIVFTHGNLLAEMFPELDTKGRKKVAGITFTNAEEIEPELILAILEKSIQFDEMHGNPFLKKSN